MEALDREVILFLNRFAGESEALDRVVRLVATTDLFKGVVAAVVIWGLWFLRGPDGAVRERRAALLATLAGTVVAVAVNRALATALEHRPRPLQDPELDFRPPIGTDAGMFSGLSAFPSDHAVMFTTLAAGVLCVSRVAGVFLIAHGLLVVFMPRLYLGLHYPTDVLAGIALGAAFAWAFRRAAARRLAGRVFLGWCARSPATFYPALFLVTVLVATLFDALARIGWLVLHLTGHAGPL